MTVICIFHTAEAYNVVVEYIREYAEKLLHTLKSGGSETLATRALKTDGIRFDIYLQGVIP